MPTEQRPDGSVAVTAAPEKNDVRTRTKAEQASFLLEIDQVIGNTDSYLRHLAKQKGTA